MTLFVTKRPTQLFLTACRDKRHLLFCHSRKHESHQDNKRNLTGFGDCDWLMFPAEWTLQRANLSSTGQVSEP